MAKTDDARGARAAERESQDGDGQSVVAELLGIIREEATKALKPAARQMALAAVKFAVQHGPDLISEKVKPALASAGEGGGSRERRQQRRTEARQRRTEARRQRQAPARTGGSRSRATSSPGRSSTAASRRTSSTAASRRTGGQSHRPRSGQRTR